MLWAIRDDERAQDGQGGNEEFVTMREQGWRVHAVNFGAAPVRSSNEEKFTNRRTEMWWNLREWIRNDAALSTVPPEVQDLLRSDLTAPKYLQRSDGRIALESKDKIRERTGRSPDHGDALALALVPRTRVRFPWETLGHGNGRRVDDRNRRLSASEELKRYVGDVSPRGLGLRDW